MNQVKEKSNKDARVDVRLAVSDKELIEKRAREHNMTISSYMVKMSIGEPVRGDGLEQATVRLLVEFSNVLPEIPKSGTYVDEMIVSLQEEVKMVWQLLK